MIRSRHIIAAAVCSALGPLTACGPGLGNLFGASATSSSSGAGGGASASTGKPSGAGAGGAAGGGGTAGAAGSGGAPADPCHAPCVLVDGGLCYDPNVGKFCAKEADAAPDAPSDAPNVQEGGSSASCTSACPAGFSVYSINTSPSACGGQGCGDPSAETVCYADGWVQVRGNCDPMFACMGGLSFVGIFPSCDCASGEFYLCAK